MLTIESLNKSFGNRRALVDVALNVPRGQMVGVIGRSGAGKSTLLRLINRLSEPTAGRVLYENTDVSRLKGRALRAWRARCAMIFQQFNLVGRLDVVTNVLVGRLSYRATLPTLFKHFSAEERTIALRALERLDMHETALQRADSLSGGQQQRVAIARALVQQPSLLLADEPIASLDPRNAVLVMDALRKINREDGITVICNLHSLDIACEYSDRIVGLAHGRVVFDGAPSALTGQAARAIYDMDAAVDEPREPMVEAIDSRRRGSRPAIVGARA